MSGNGRLLADLIFFALLLSDEAFLNSVTIEECKHVSRSGQPSADSAAGRVPDTGSTDTVTYELAALRL
jgi:hypothetical protein